MEPVNSNELPPDAAAGIMEVEKQLKADQDRITNEEFEKLKKQEMGDHAEEFSKIKGMGFVSKKDLEDNIKALREEHEQTKREFLVLKEMLLRAKAQGKAVIPAEEAKKEEYKDIFGGIVPGI